VLVPACQAYPTQCLLPERDGHWPYSRHDKRVAECVMTYASLACRLICCLVFVVSSYGKLHNKPAFEEFVSWVGSLWTLSARFRRPLAIAVAASEILAVLLIAIPRTSAVGLVLAAALFFGFSIGIFVIIRSKRTIGCNCFGASAAQVGIQHLVRNLLLCAIAVAGIASIGPRATDPAGVVLVIGIAVVIATLLVSLDEIGMLFANPVPNAEMITREQAR
jgi:uncharacterized membrane protein YphA (DoxX/SURF4 family)